MKEKITAIFIYGATMLAVMWSMWTMGKLFADNISSYEVISPKPGVECIVVSRMFNTSVDCWNQG